MANTETRFSGQSGFSDGAQPHYQVSEDMILKVGTAVGRVALIQQAFAERMHSESRQAVQQDLADQAQQEAVAAIDAEGLSIEDYNAVVTAAEGDPGLEKQLLSAARAVL
jgi:ribonucleotide reductase beta subunit family protein with ferritin-like domain